MPGRIDPYQDLRNIDRTISHCEETVKRLETEISGLIDGSLVPNLVSDTIAGKQYSLNLFKRDLEIFVAAREGDTLRKRIKIWKKMMEEIDNARKDSPS